DDIPISLPSTYKDESLHLRNKLLLFRFRRFGDTALTEGLVDRTIEPRLNQIFVPLLSLAGDAEMRAELRELAQRYNRELVVERGMDAEAYILEILRDLLAWTDETAVSVKTITSCLIERHGFEYDRKITPRRVGGLIRRRLGLVTHKSHGVFVVSRTELPKLPRLCQPYGVDMGTRA